MKRFMFLRVSVVLSALPCVVLAQAQPAPKQGQPAPKPAAVLPPKTPSPQMQADLLAGVRDQAARLRSVPIPGGAQSLHENSAQRAVDHVKVLHDWNGDPKSAGWTFPIGKSK